ncbi:hypothetical protein RAA17_15740 [Komagataeibacter rhaeticus]|nr:hypothetical protein [Komagataeibacter rhaeticus]
MMPEGGKNSMNCAPAPTTAMTAKSTSARCCVLASRLISPPPAA